MKFGDVQDELLEAKSQIAEVDRLRDDATEARAEAQLLETERERLSSEVERLEKSLEVARSGDPDAVLAERDARLEALLKQVADQNAELARLRDLASALPRRRTPPRGSPAPAPAPPPASLPTPELEVFELDLDAKDEDDLFVLEDSSIIEEDEDEPLKKK